VDAVELVTERLKRLRELLTLSRVEIQERFLQIVLDVGAPPGRCAGSIPYTGGPRQIAMQRGNNRLLRRGVPYFRRHVAAGVGALLGSSYWM